MERPVNVVVVEDERVLRRGLVLTTPWDRYGCAVIGEAANGIEGIELIEKTRPDLVLTDIRMPGCGGLEMIERLGDRESIEFIIISGYAEFAFAQRALEFGVHAYILKPIDDKQLTHAIQRTVRVIQRKRRTAHSRVSPPPGCLPTVVEAATDYRDRYLATALDIIGRHYAEQLTARDVALALGISESSYAQLFRDRTGYTFLQYLTSYRLKRAAEIMATQQVRVNEVAVLVGYRDVRHFCRLFKREFGITPQRFRQG